MGIRVLFLFLPLGDALSASMLASEVRNSAITLFSQTHKNFTSYTEVRVTQTWRVVAEGAATTTVHVALFFVRKLSLPAHFFISVTELVCHVMPRNTLGKNMSMAQHEQREQVHLFVCSIAQLWVQGSGYYGAFPLLLDTPNVNKVRRKPDEMMPKVKDIIWEVELINSVSRLLCRKATKTLESGLKCFRGHWNGVPSLNGFTCYWWVDVKSSLPLFFLWTTYEWTLDNFICIYTYITFIFVFSSDSNW